jgi:Recombinase zinc beta ribbon domain
MNRAVYLRAERLCLSPRKARQLYVLRTHVKCGRCGSSCTGSHGGRQFHYYRCNGIAKPRADRTKCNLPQFRDVILEDKVWSWLCSDVLSEDRIRAAIAALDDDTEGERARVEGERSIIARQLETLDIQASKLIELYTAGGFVLDEVAAQKTHLDHARESCRNALAELDDRLAGMATAKERADELCELVRSVRDGLPDLPNEERYRIINLLDVQITLDFEGEAGRGKHPVLFADAVYNLTLDSIRLWVLGHQDAVGNKTTTVYHVWL